MGIIAQWGEINIEITAENALLFKELKVTAEAETDDKTKNKQKYVAYKNGKPADVSFDLDVLAVFGQDVRQIVTLFLNAAQRGEKQYFYVGGEKIFPAQLMMTKAEASEIEISPSGKWVRAKIAISAKQADAAYIIPDPEKEKKKSGGGSGKSGKASVKTNPVNSDTYSGMVAANTQLTNASGGKTQTQQTYNINQASNALNQIKSVTGSAKNTSSAVTNNSTGSSSTKITAGLPSR